MGWIETTIYNHSDRKVIMLYHGWLADGAISDGAIAYGRDNSAEDIWDVVKKFDNVFMVLSGHTWDVGRRVETTEGGSNVYMLMGDFCDDVSGDGGGGFMRTITFSPAEDKFEVNTYSPHLDASKTDPENEFEYTNLGIFPMH